MSQIRAPKQWCLTKAETINSFENWRQNLVYTLSLDPHFAPFLVEGVTWLKKSKTNPLRGFVDDSSSVPEARRRTAQQKSTMLELMLGQIANYCPIISRNTIVKSSTSIEFIWHAIRLHFGFQATGAHFVDFNDIQLEPNERPEDLYQRLMAFVDDSLLKSNGNLTHHGDPPSEDEELSPTLENFIVLTWLRLINPALPQLVKQRYGTELRSRTLASIKPEISQAMSSLLDQISTCEDAKIMRAEATFKRLGFNKRPPSRSPKPPRKPATRARSCPLCKQAGRVDQHFLSECKYLPEQDRRYMAKARQIASILEPEEDSEDEPPVDDTLSPTLKQPSITSRLVQVRQSPYIDVFNHHHSTRITIDSGATCNMIRLSTVHRLGADIKASSQSARQADGYSPLKVMGETNINFTRDQQQFYFEGLVVENLDVEILAGTPFMEANDVAVRPARREVIVGNGSIYHYGSTDNSKSDSAVRHAVILRAPPASTIIWPGEFVEIELPKDLPSDTEYALEPRYDCASARSTTSSLWPPPHIVSSVAGKIRVPNLSDQPHVLKRHEHFCQVRPVFTPDDIDNKTSPVLPLASSPNSPQLRSHSSNVHLDPDRQLSPDMTAKFRAILLDFDKVFDSQIECYNGASGPFQATVNMGPVEPPQRKGRLPQYGRDKLVELQHKFDDLEKLGVFKRPEDINVSVEYLNPSFLVKKANGGFRLVTAFADVGRYSKPQPSLMPDVDSTLRQIAQWKYLIATDLTSAFYQIPLAHESMKYCGVATPFRGVRVYTRSAMGMPGSETALEELMCRVLGDLIQDGCVAKIADDLYCGGNSPEQLLQNWTRVLHALQRNNLRLSASKTIICPKSTTILGWTWSQGSLSATPHRISALASCATPENVRGMKSFIGAYKVLARVIPGCSSILAPLDDAIAGRPSTDRIKWNDDLREVFHNAQKALSTSRTITLPRPCDQLWIVTDGALRKPGIGATLYVTRSGKLLLAGFFSAKLRAHQLSWLPCEVEALAIAAATKHFAPYIIQASSHPCILTDSKPCVQAYEKLCRGEFSASPRVSTFLSTVSRFHASVQHVAGASILPSDFASRNAPDCEDMACQVCNFVNQAQSSVVNHVTAADILSGKASLPFTSRTAWLSIQSDCADLRRTHAHLRQGTRPSKKVTNATDVKRYLNVTTIAKDGLLVVKHDEPLSAVRERIVVPRPLLDGLLTSLHIKLSHPSAHQMKMVTRRYLFALDLDKAIVRVSDNCHHCASLREIPHHTVEQSTTDPPEKVGVAFAADVIKRNRQLILVLRECVTSFTSSTLIDDERHQTLRDALIRLCIELRPLDGPPAVIRSDPAPGFNALTNDELLRQHRITLEIGRTKNINKNPVAEKAVQELEMELLRQDPLNGTVTPLSLSAATATLNSRIRSRGLSAREMWTQRDQFSGSQLPVNDRDLITEQHNERLRNHPFSVKAKAPSGKSITPPPIYVGDLVYLYTDRSKSSPRDRYMVVSTEENWCNIKKFRGSQLRNTSYRVKRSECYKVPSHIEPRVNPQPSDSSDDEDALCTQTPSPQPPKTPDIPAEISLPLNGAPSEGPTLTGLDTGTPRSLPSPVTEQRCDPPGDASRQLRRSSRRRRSPSYLSDYEH